MKHFCRTLLAVVVVAVNKDGTVQVIHIYGDT
jgi:hypothetical protein